MTNTLLHDRALIRLSGEDVRGFLQGLVTNDVAGPLPVWTALLTPQGKCLFDFMVWADPAGGDDLLIDCEAAAAEALTKRLTLYRLRRPIALSPEPRLAVHWAVSGDAGIDDPRLSALGKRWLAAPSGADVSDSWHAHRLGLGVAEGVAELGNGATLWLECNAAELNGVSFSKGCYVGQENTARMNWRQKVNRRIVVLPLVETDPKRRMQDYPALGLTVEHWRVADIPDHGWRRWMGDRTAAEDGGED
jgi:folate-binding protein YgfZ